MKIFLVILYLITNQGGFMDLKIIGRRECSVNNSPCIIHVNKKNIYKYNYAYYKHTQCIRI